MTDDAASRWLNGVLYSDPSETFSSRIYRRRLWFWWLVLWVDFEAQRRFGEEPGHCRRAWLEHRARQCDALDRMRLAGL